MSNSDPASRWTPDTIIRLIQAIGSALATLLIIMRAVRRRLSRGPRTPNPTPESRPGRDGHAPR